MVRWGFAKEKLLRGVGGCLWVPFREALSPFPLAQGFVSPVPCPSLPAPPDPRHRPQLWGSPLSPARRTNRSAPLTRDVASANVNGIKDKAPKPEDSVAI